MKAIQLTAPNKLELVEKPIPKPKAGEVLIKMAFSPINPSDLAFLSGSYGVNKGYPVVPGFEGSGVVVENGGGMYGRMLTDKNVACVVSPKYDGTWAEYMVTEAKSCVKLGKNVPLDQGAMFFVNPLTAISFIKIKKKESYDLIVMSAAASALGKMTLHLANEAGIPFIGLVRKEDQLEELVKNSVLAAIDVSKDSYREKLKSTCSKFRKVLYLDCVAAGETPYKILSCIPGGSKMLIYGQLELNQKPVIIPADMIFHHYSIEGFWLQKKICGFGFLEIFSMTGKVNKLLAGGFENKIASKLALDEFDKGLSEYVNNMSGGKVLFAM